MKILGYIIWTILVLFFLYVFFIRPYVLARKKFVCLRCGQCCGLRVKLSKQEIEKIQKAGYSHFLTKRNNLKRINGSCIFLKKDGKITTCSIEPVKPEICKTFPAQKGLFGNKRDIRCKTCHGKLK